MNMDNVKIEAKYLLATANLIQALQRESIPFEVAYVYHGFIVGFPSLGEDRTGDVILHDGSYGNSFCAFEGYGDMSTFEGDVCVFDEIEDVIEQAKKKYKAE